MGENVSRDKKREGRRIGCERKVKRSGNKIEILKSRRNGWRR